MPNVDSLHSGATLNHSGDLRAVEGAPRELTYAQALNEALAEEMRRDPSVVLLGEDIAVHGGLFTVTRGLLQEFGPERVRDTPISEEIIASTGVGAALGGLRPIVELQYINFATLAMDPIVNQAAKLRYMYGGAVKIPLVVRTQEGAGRRNAAQHSECLEAWFFHVPGLKVVVPSTPADAKGLLKSAIRDDNPVIFIEHKMLYFRKGPVPLGEFLVPLGVADIKRPGRDATVVAIHTMVHKALAAAERLTAEGIDIEIIDPRTLNPLDVQTIVESVRRTGRLVICHEACRQGGVGAEIGMRVVEEAFDYLDAPVVRVCGADVPIAYNEGLERAALPQEDDIVEAVQRVCATSR